MSRIWTRVFGVMLSLAVVAAACGGDDDDDASSDTTNGDSVEIDYKAIGLWDDGPCDEARDPLVLGLMTIFESPLLSLKDQALALEASAKAFNARGGANGACIEVHT